MARTRALRRLISASVTGALALALIAPGPVDDFPPPKPTPAGNAAPADETTVAGLGQAAGTPPVFEEPRPPLLPADFRGEGRYVVRDLGIDVPFTWQGRGGDSQMIAGGPEHPIWFTNVIYRNTLYTLTYKWPGIPATPPRQCDRVGFFNRQILNDLLKTARYVGPEILQGKKDRRVDHWRVGVVGGSTQPGENPRFPIALGDVYVDQRNPSQWWQVLQFGFQNLFDPALDEWFTMTTFSHQPGTVTLPDRCPPPL
ncbi:hypothetical protein FXF53_25730 [Micromonospora sp. WP24]|uniref:hypothetical protein n=1 Tax=Micromonospora sp. WP24 TaxID=2604469 RepID=UPI0011D84BCB|nr:hypothetical protein [Micromonospora sp. WP24]TYB95073.1 hypothetical protein FXF53_25730 [Micromonospora sp. WP24]